MCTSSGPGRYRSVLWTHLPWLGGPGRRPSRGALGCISDRSPRPSAASAGCRPLPVVLGLRTAATVLGKLVAQLTDVQADQDRYHHNRGGHCRSRPSLTSRLTSDPPLTFCLNPFLPTLKAR